MGDATAPDWNPDPLPRGRHRLSADDVRASQRERLLRAMLELVAENGYQPTSVPDVVTRARVSRSSFYQEFDGKLDCFLALCDEYSRGMIDEVLEAAGDLADRPWREVIEGGMNAYLCWWRDRPEFARAFLVELPTVGTVGLEYRIDLLRPFEDLFAGLARYMRATDRNLSPLPKLAPRSVVRGTTELIAEEVRRGRVGKLPEMTGDLVDVISVGLGAAPVPSRR
ncbi:MAG: TetR/AcrR family transcriptional regulator [Solirubrobacterales bacterium]|nr:TetR/AcrR family transcriptional regulator [Solirubrobacterales bacterium]